MEYAIRQSKLFGDFYIENVTTGYFYPARYSKRAYARTVVNWLRGTHYSDGTPI